MFLLIVNLATTSQSQWKHNSPGTSSTFPLFHGYISSSSTSLSNSFCYHAFRVFQSDMMAYSKYYMVTQRFLSINKKEKNTKHFFDMSNNIFVLSLLPYSNVKHSTSTAKYINTQKQHRLDILCNMSFLLSSHNMLGIKIPVVCCHHFSHKTCHSLQIYWIS